MGSCRIHPHEERLVLSLRLVHERNGRLGNYLIERGHVVFYARHWPRRQRSLVHDLLLADLSPARLDRGIISIRRPAMDQVTRADSRLPFRRIGVPERILHRVQMIEITEVFIEPMHRRQKFVAVAEMVLAKLSRSVAHRLEGGGDGWRLGWHSQGRAGLADRGEASTNWQ